MTTEADFENLPWLHVYGQYAWHGEVVVRGTRDGLLAFRDALNKAIETGDGEQTAYASDGEGYTVQVVRVNTHTALGTPEYIMETKYELGRQEIRRREWISPDRRAKRADIEVKEIEG